MAKPIPLCILFLHHRDDALTRRNFDQLRRSNPDAAIVLLVDEPEGALPGAIDVSRFENPGNTENKWRSCDTMIYRWFRNRSFDAERYVVLEYDCWCTVDLLDYYREFEDADAVASRVQDPVRNSNWRWFAEASRLGDDERFATGMLPIAGIFLKHDALVRICENLSTADVISELRIGTAVRRAGLRLRELSPAKRRRIDWPEYRYPIVRPGLYHAVKRVDHNWARLIRLPLHMVDLLRHALGRMR